MSLHVNLSKAKAKLLLDQPYLGTLASRLELVASDRIGAVLCDGMRLEYNELYLEALSLDELGFVLASGAMHAVLAHKQRQKGRLSWLWQLATDYAINAMLVQNGMSAPQGVGYEPQMQLLLLGRGADEAMLRERAGGLTCIHFEGFVENVGDYIGAFDLFAFPSNNEGLGSTLLDVMAQEVAIIASRVGGIVDLIEHEHSGLLVRPRDARALAEAIERLYHNPYERAALAKAAKNGLEAFSVEAMTHAYEQLYNSL